MIVYQDLETFCETPITQGTHRYAEKAEITVWAFAIDDGPVTVWDLTTGASMPATLKAAHEHPEAVHVFHNSHFDRTVLRHNGIDLPTRKIHDTMVQAMAHSLPGSLGKLCEILQIPTDQAKDKRGKSLIQLFCKPRPKNMKLRRATRETHPTEWQEFLDYARSDIEAMRAIYKKLPKWNCGGAERELWLLDQKINDRGVAIDMDLVHCAITAVERAQLGLGEDARRLTDDAVQAATQRDAMIRHILAAYGIQMEDMRGDTVERMIDNENYPIELRELLRVRLQASTTSVAKYKALNRATSSDGRLRGTLQFCGAIRTGRWAGRIFQPQNLPRPAIGDLHDDELQEAIDFGIESLGADCADLFYDNVMELTSSALRGTIIAPPGKKLVIADLSNIEGRVLAWLAGEDWKVEAFRQFDQGIGHDLYKLAYARAFGIRPEDVEKHMRQIGKVMELGLGFEGGVGAFITFAAVYALDLELMAEKAMPALGKGLISEAQDALAWTTKQKRNTYGLPDHVWIACEAIKRAWRYAHPRTVSMWKDLANAARSAIGQPGKVITCGRVQLVKNKAWLRIILPSGRSLCYPSAAVDESGQISYMGINQYSRRWERLKSYGGKLAENVTQAVARDVLASSMPDAEDLGYEIVLTVHDEIISETPDNSQFDAEGLASFMVANPRWAEGLPLAAAGFETYRYRKD